MRSKTQMSPKSKKILTVIGVGFGTVMVFIVSFILAFSFIITPPSFFTANDSDMAKENEKLKAEMQTMTDTIEHLNTTVDKYKAQASRPQQSVPAVVTTPDADTTNGEDGKTDNPDSQKPDTNGTSNADDRPSGGVEDFDSEEVFSPDTVESAGEQTAEDIEAPIPVIDVSE